jgi:hypothetical protein
MDSHASIRPTFFRSTKKLDHYDPPAAICETKIPTSQAAGSMTVFAAQTACTAKKFCVSSSLEVHATRVPRKSVPYPKSPEPPHFRLRRKILI